MAGPDSELYPTNTFTDPLLMPTYLKTNDHQSIHVQCESDWLLSSYVGKLNQEIIDDIKEFADHKPLLVSLFNAVRKFGWCGVQFYKTHEKVFSSCEFVDWIKELDEESNKYNRVGMKVSWTDDIGNTWNDSLYFDDRINENGEIEGRCYLFIWEQGDGRVLVHAPAMSAFAIADVNTAVLSLAIQCRQIQGSLAASATNPYFYFLKYGDSATKTQTAKLRSQMQYIGPKFSIGAKGSILDEIIAIENGSVEKCVAALVEYIAFFAAETRLPISYFLGEKQTGGLGDTGESTDQVIISKKKEFVLQHFLSGLQEMFIEQFSQTLPDLSKFYTQQMEADEKKQEDLLKQSKDKQGVNANE